MIILIKGQEEETQGGARQWRYMGVKSNSSKLCIRDQNTVEENNSPNLSHVEAIKPWNLLICKRDLCCVVVAQLCNRANVDKPLHN